MVYHCFLCQPLEPQNQNFCEAEAAQAAVDYNWQLAETPVNKANTPQNTLDIKPDISLMEQ